MASLEKLPMLQEGYTHLQTNLHRLKTIERPSVVEAIEEARAHGDLSETPNIMPPRSGRARLKP